MFYIYESRLSCTACLSRSQFTNDEDGLFEHPALCATVILDVRAIEISAVPQQCFRSLLVFRTMPVFITFRR